MLFNAFYKRYMLFGKGFVRHPVPPHPTEREDTWQVQFGWVNYRLYDGRKLVRVYESSKLLSFVSQLLQR